TWVYGQTQYSVTVGVDAGASGVESADTNVVTNPDGSTVTDTIVTFTDGSYVEVVTSADSTGVIQNQYPITGGDVSSQVKADVSTSFIWTSGGEDPAV